MACNRWLCLSYRYVMQVNIGPDVVGDISKIRIEHDGRMPGKGWHLDKARMLAVFHVAEYLIKVKRL